MSFISPEKALLEKKPYQKYSFSFFVVFLFSFLSFFFNQTICSLYSMNIVLNSSVSCHKDITLNSFISIAHTEQDAIVPTTTCVEKCEIDRTIKPSDTWKEA